MRSTYRSLGPSDLAMNNSTEERAIERYGDSAVGRGRRGGGKHRHGGGHKHKRPPSPESETLRAKIKQVVTSGSVPGSVVSSWASARAGAPSGKRYDKLMKRMRACIEKRNAKVAGWR